MTTLACWVAADSRGPTSVYVATDSRISWSSGMGKDVWDHGIKTFASSRTADIFGYVGDVLFPAIVLSQFVQAADAGLFCERDFRSRSGSLLKLVETGWSSLPTRQRRQFVIVHCGRDGGLMDSSFRVALIRVEAQHIERETKATPTRSSAFVLIQGSGAPWVNRAAARWKRTPAESTSRAHFWALADAVMSGCDPATGGSPQLVGLYRRGNGRAFGHIDRSKRKFVAGMPVHFTPRPSDMEWRNENFERMDAQTRRRVKKAQLQPRP